MSLAMDSERALAPGAVARGRSAFGLAELLLLVALILLPLIASRYILVEIFGIALVFGVIALSLQFLAGYGGMVSLAQMAVAGVAGYGVGILGANTMGFGLGWPWWAAVPVSLSAAVLAATGIGLLAIRTAGIYTIMITLAIATAFHYFTLQNYEIFNGYNGINGISPPKLFGINWKDPIPFYYLLLVPAVLAYAAVVYVARAPFGLALQGIRDNPRRMAAIGYNVTAHRVAAYTFAGLIAGIGGVLLVWHTGSISPGTIGVGACIDILIIAVIGGIRHPIGPFIGALAFALLSTFAMDIVEVLIPRERFKLVIGLGFLAIVLFSPDGLVGLWQRIFRRRSAESP